MVRRPGNIGLQHETPLTSSTDHRISISNVVRDVDEKDARARYKEEEADIGVRTTGLRCLGDGDGGRDDSDEDVFIVAWEENDPDNPYNWSTVKFCPVYWTQKHCGLTRTYTDLT